MAAATPPHGREKTANPPTGGGLLFATACGRRKEEGVEVMGCLNGLFVEVRVCLGCFGGCFEGEQSSCAGFSALIVSGEREIMSDFLIFGVLSVQIVMFVVGLWAFFTLSQNLRESEERLNARADSRLGFGSNCSNIDGNDGGYRGRHPPKP